MMVQLAPPRPQGGQLADHIRAAPGRKNANRFQPLTMEKVDFWEDVAKKSSPPTAHQPLLAAPDLPPILKPHSRISPTAHLSQEGMSKGTCKGKDAHVGSGGHGVDAYKILPVVTPSKANSKVDKQWFLRDLEDSLAKIGAKQRVVRASCAAPKTIIVG